MLDYETLRVIWWALLGILLIGIAVMDGFDLGSAILLPIVGRTDLERRIVINTVGPVWEGNQVWLILGGGAIFAAWPLLYAVAFSGFYLAMLLLLLSLILRPVGFKFRSKLEGKRWRVIWDAALFVGGLVPALVYGVAFGNVLQGVPFHFDDTLRMTYEGSLLGLFNPFALLCGLVSVAMIIMHGATWLAVKTEAPVRPRAQRAAVVAGAAMIVLFLAGGVWASAIDGYVLGHFAGTNAPSNPLTKQVTRATGQLLANYGANPWMLVAPVVALVAAGSERSVEPDAPRGGGRVPRQRNCGCRCDCDRGTESISLPAAVILRSGIEFDGVGRVIELDNAWHHVGGDRGVPADRDDLHRLGLSGIAWPRDGKLDHERPAFGLLA